MDEAERFTGKRDAAIAKNPWTYTATGPMNSQRGLPAPLPILRLLRPALALATARAFRLGQLPLVALLRARFGTTLSGRLGPMVISQDLRRWLDN
jgi:hypothetical protein